MNSKTQIKPNDLEHLRKMLRKYAHCWSQFPSDRLAGWASKYDSGRNDHPEVWAAYCAQYNLDPTHNAGDILA